MSERLTRGSELVRSRAFTVVASAAVLAVAFTLCRRGIDLTDEGYLLSQALDMLGANGKVLYRDMDSFVTPGVWFLVAGVFKLVEPSVLASRMLSFACYGATIFFAFRIVDRSATRNVAWASVASMLIGSLWAFPAWTIVFYSPFAILFALVGLERLLAWRDSRRARDLLLCGLSLGVSVAFKQNYGALALIGAGAALPLLRLEKGEAMGAAVVGAVGDSLRITAGVALAVLPFVAYFASEGALSAIYQSLIVHPFVFMGRQDIAFPELARLWAAQPLQNADVLTYGSYSLGQVPSPFESETWEAAWMDVHKRLHLLLFWLPPVGAAVGAWLALRPGPSRRPVDGSLASILLVAGCVFLGVFPRADFNHLMNVYQPVIVAAAVLGHRLIERAPRPATLLFRSAASLAGLMGVIYLGIAGFWYVHYLQTMKARIAGDRGGVLVDAMDRDMIDFQVDTIRRETAEGDFVLTIPALAMFNFLADRPMPGRYYNLYEHHIAHDEGQSVVDAVEAHGVDLVVSSAINFFSDRVGLRAYAPKLAQHLNTHFEPERDVAGDRFRYLRRRDQPLALRDGSDVVNDCNLPEGSKAYVREHLLFAGLYQPRNEKKPAAPINTTCRFKVPDRAELVFSLAYRRPIRVQPGATIQAEIWVTGSGRDVPLFSETIRTKRQEGWSSPPPEEYRVDLSRFAGREVQFLFHARFLGRAQMDPNDIAGYSLVWQGPRVEIRNGRALLVGIDGATLRIIEPLIEAGRLPHLASIARQGVSGPLRSAKPIVSPRIWTTIATGKRPEKHGIAHWVYPTEDGEYQLFLGSDRTGPAIWNILSSRGLSTGVVNWLNSYPPEKINGIVVSDFAVAGTRDSREKLFARNEQPKGRVGQDVTFPVEWSAEFERLSQEAPLLPIANPFEGDHGMPSWMNSTIPAQSFRDDDVTTRAALAVDSQIKPDLLMVYLSGIDKVSHNLWGALEPAESYPAHIQFTPEERAATVSIFESYYEYTDQLIGKLLERFDSDDLVMVVSDHGFEHRLFFGALTGGHDTEEALDGVLFARGWRIAAAEELPFTGIADITPTILTWFGMPTGSTMDGRVAKFLDIQTGAPNAAYDQLPIERVGDGRADVEDAIIDQLRGLGYVE